MTSGSQTKEEYFTLKNLAIGKKQTLSTHTISAQNTLAQHFILLSSNQKKKFLQEESTTLQPSKEAIHLQNKHLSFPKSKQQFTKESLFPLTLSQQALSNPSYPFKPQWQNKSTLLLRDQKDNNNLTLMSLTTIATAHLKETPHPSSMETDPKAGPS